MDDELRRRGEQMRRQVHGDARIDAMMSLRPDLTAPFEEVADSAYGAVWARTTELSQKLRSLVTVAIISTLGEEDELRAHLRAARLVGWSEHELLEALLHTVLYAGAPRGQRAMHVALEVFAEVDAELAEGGRQRSAGRIEHPDRPIRDSA